MNVFLKIEPRKKGGVEIIRTKVILLIIKGKKSVPLCNCGT